MYQIVLLYLLFGSNRIDETFLLKSRSAFHTNTWIKFWQNLMKSPVTHKFFQLEKLECTLNCEFAANFCWYNSFSGSEPASFNEPVWK